MSRQLTPQDKRTIRIAAICIAVYLVLFYGASVVKTLNAQRESYDNLVLQAKELRDVIKPYEDKIVTATNLMDRFHMDPAKLKRTTLMAQASAAIQDAAAAEHVGVGPIRETPGRPSAKEIGSMQFEGTGPIPAVLALLHHLDRVGFPVVIDTVQFSSEARGPNAVKVNLTIVVLDFDAWKPKEEPAHA